MVIKKTEKQKKLSEKMKRELEKSKQAAKEFEIQFKKSLNIALVTGFGFLIALTWKEVIIEIVNKIVQQGPIAGKLISALVVTFVCVIGIMAVSKFLVVKEEEAD